MPAASRATPGGRAHLALCVCLLVSFALRLSVSLGLPVWGWDERRYLAAAWGFLSGVTPSPPLRNALYPFLLQPVFFLGDTFHAGVKLLNAALVSLAIVPLYGLASKYLRPGQALTVAVVSVWLGENTITGHTMTEALIFPVFCTVLWALVRLNTALFVPGRQVSWRAALLGVTLGALCHATPKHRPVWLAVVGSLLLVGGLGSRRTDTSGAMRGRWQSVAVAAGALGAALVVTVVGLNVVIHGRPLGLTVDRYDGVATRIVQDFLPSARVHLAEASDMVIAHVATTGSFLGAAVALALVGGGAAIVRRDTERLALLGPVVLAAGAYAVLAVVVAIAIDNGNESLTFARYYYFTYPGLLIGAIVVASGPPGRTDTFWVTLAVAVALGAAAYTFGSGLSTVSPYSGIIENADFWYFTFPRTYPLVVVAGSSAVLLALFRWRRSLPHVLLAYVAVYSAISTVSQARLNGFGREGLTACYHLHRLYPLEGARVGLLSDSRHRAEVSAFRPPFTLRPRILTTGIVRGEDLPEDVQYVFVDGDLSVEADTLEAIAQVEGCSLWRVTNSR